MSVAAKLSVCVTVVECTKTNHSHQNALEMHVKASESNIAQCGEVWVPESELFKLYLTCLHCQQQPLHLLSLSLSAFAFVPITKKVGFFTSKTYKNEGQATTVPFKDAFHPLPHKSASPIPELHCRPVAKR